VIPVAATLSVWEACLLGLVQGLTEFLPISSDGHLALLQHFLTPMPADQRLAVDVALHIGTLVAVLFYFRAELMQMAAALFGRAEPPWARAWIWLLAIATVPAAIVGLTLKHRIEATYDSLLVIGVSFLITGTLLYLASAVRGAARAENDIGVGDAVMIGSFQALALLPGVSRSGTTISAGLFRHIRSDAAAKFSFLLSIPAIGGAVVLELGDIVGLIPSMAGPLLAGVLVAGVTGLAAIAVLMRAIRAGRLNYFAYYCWVLGIAVLGGAMLRGGQ
jgi:undecaprenyl-diphosphatase